MSKSPIAIAVLLLAALLSNAAPARGLSLRLGPLGAVGSVFGRILPLGRSHRHHAFAHHRPIRHAALSKHEQNRPNEQAATESPPQPREGGDQHLLGDPKERGQIAAAAALAGWRGGHDQNAGAWWSHGHGGYGWVGPLFWPFAYDDIYDYTLFGDGIGFWDYGYPDVYAAIFGPYRHDDLAGYMAQPARGRRRGRLPDLAQLCGDDSGEIAGFAVDQIRQAIQPTDAQRAALDELAKVSNQAAQLIRGACPTQTASTAPGRLAAMAQRIDAMVKAELALQPPLDKLYDSLDDGQKARLNALAQDRRKATAEDGAKEPPVQGCAAAEPALQWPSDEIEARLHPDDSQRAALHVLQHASARALDILNDVCRPNDALTPPARLAALDRRLDAMQQAVRLVSDALEDFYATLSDEQKAQFEAIGPTRTA